MYLLILKFISFLLSASMCHRLRTLSNDLKGILQNGQDTDVVLNVQGKRIQAHKIILKARSPVFLAMFTHDMMEKKTNEVNIEEIDSKVFDTVLHFMYYGETNGPLSIESVLDVYSTAIKYDIKDLRKICKKFVHQNLSVDWICDVIEFADLFHDQKIGQAASNYFKQNAQAVLQTGRWQIFKRQKAGLAFILMEEALKNRPSPTNDPNFIMDDS